MKKSIIIVSTLAGVLLAACSSPTVPIPSSTAATNSASAADSLTQTNVEASVTVAVTPLDLDDQAAATLDFDIALNTHSVDLGYDLTQRLRR